jgi:hypothetical protein
MAPITGCPMDEALPVSRQNRFEGDSPEAVNSEELTLYRATSSMRSPLEPVARSVVALSIGAHVSEE